VTSYSLKYIRNQDIDRGKWDLCIDSSSNGLVYAYSWYLDKMADDWDAIIMGDYSIVFPLPFRKKFGINYVYQPAFTAQLGIFGNDLSPAMVQSFINAIPSKFRLLEINLNAGNPLETSETVIRRQNFVLDLSSSFEDLEKQFRENIKRNSRKADQYGLRFTGEVNIDEVIFLSKQHMLSLTNLNDKDYLQFKELTLDLVEKNKAMIYGVRNDTGNLLASAVFFFSHKRIYYILVGNHPNGKTLGASHFLLSSFIKKYSGQDLILDFEGSDIKSLAFFYSSFGATLETYPALRIYRLPWWAKIFKKV
jgi:hypothetical protein